MGLITPKTDQPLSDTDVPGLGGAIWASAPVMTPTGPYPAGSLRVGQSVLTTDGPRDLIWCRTTSIDASARGVEATFVRRHALGNGMPRCDLAFGPDVLLWTTRTGLLSYPTRRLTNTSSFTQLLFAEPALIGVGGVLVTSFRPELLTELPADARARAEVFGHFPEFEHLPEAYGLPKPVMLT